MAPYAKNTINARYATVLLLAPLIYLCADIYTIAIPELSQTLNTYDNLMQQSISVLILGVIISQLIYGPISEMIGRKKPILFGLSVATVASFLSFLGIVLHHLVVFFVGQFLVGTGLGACSLYRAILKSNFEGEDLSKRAATVIALNNFAAPASPYLGALIQVYISPYAIFLAVMLINLLCLLYTYYYFDEGEIIADVEKIKPIYILQLYGLILNHRVFRGYGLCNLCSMGAYFSWVIALPAFAIKYHAWSPDQFGLAMLLINGFSMVSGSLLAKLLVGRRSEKQLLELGWTLMIIASLLMLIYDQVIGNDVITAFVFMAIFQFGTAFLWPSYYVKAFEPFKESAGYAASIFSCFYLGGPFISAFFIGLLPESNLVPLASILLISTVCTWLFHRYLIEPYNRPIIT